MLSVPLKKTFSGESSGASGHNAHHHLNWLFLRLVLAFPDNEDNLCYSSMTHSQRGKVNASSTPVTTITTNAAGAISPQGMSAHSRRIRV